MGRTSAADALLVSLGLLVALSCSEGLEGRHRQQLVLLMDEKAIDGEWQATQVSISQLMLQSRMLEDEVHVLFFGNGTHAARHLRCNGASGPRLQECLVDFLGVEEGKGQGRAGERRFQSMGTDLETGHEIQKERESTGYELAEALMKTSMLQRDSSMKSMVVVVTRGLTLSAEELSLAADMHRGRRQNVILALTTPASPILTHRLKDAGLPFFHVQSEFQALLSEVMSESRDYENCLEILVAPAIDKVSVNEDLPVVVEVTNHCSFPIIGHTLHISAAARIDDVVHYRPTKVSLAYVASDATWANRLQMRKREKRISYRTVPSSLLVELRDSLEETRLRFQVQLDSQLYRKDLEDILRRIQVNGTTVQPVVAVVGPMGSGKSTLINHLITCSSNRNSVVEVAKPCGGESHCTLEVKTFTHKVGEGAVLKYRDTYGITGRHSLLKSGLLEGMVKDRSAVDADDVTESLLLVGTDERPELEAHVVLFVLPQTLRQFIGAAEEGEEDRLEMYRTRIKSIRRHSVIGIVSMWQDVPEAEKDELLVEFSKEFDIPLSDLLPFGIEVSARDVRQTESDFQAHDILYKAVASALTYINYVHIDSVGPDFLELLDAY